MAKQIYIDENGNENLVSGTINYGSLLPMSPNDPDKVADRITALETALSNNTATLGENISGGVWYKKYGNMVWCCGRITTTASISTNSVLFSGIPSNNFNGNNVIKGIDNDGVSADCVMYQAQSTGSMRAASNIASGKTYIISFIYYTAS